MKHDETQDLHLAAGYHTSDNKNPDIRPLAEMERLYIEEVISYCRGSIPKAAHMLRISPSTIYRKQAQWRRQQH